MYYSHCILPYLPIVTYLKRTAMLGWIPLHTDIKHSMSKTVTEFGRIDKYNSGS